uniref:Uncharacterized protein n=1 Tax=Arundo donax TaxID=35708 RepID=A0A0A9EQN9_ARUDO
MPRRSGNPSSGESPPNSNAPPGG